LKLNLNFPAPLPDIRRKFDRWNIPLCIFP